MIEQITEVLGPEITPMIVNLAITVLTILFTYLGVQVKKLMSKVERTKEVEQIKATFETNQELALATVEYVEKIGNHLLSEEKLHLAMEKATNIANSKGLEITQTELRVLIEQALYGFEKGYTSDIHMEQNLVESPDGEVKEIEDTEDVEIADSQNKE